MDSYKLTYKRFSETSILIQWPQIIGPKILEDLLLFKTYLLNSDRQSISQITNAYNSLLISYDSHLSSFEDEIFYLESIYASRTNIEETKHKLWKIPVCYDTVFGLDLEEICNTKKICNSELIHLHSEVVYKVYFIGFLPGFLYLGGLNECLFMPRKESPRQHIEKGSVAIGGEQTGIYPNASPGGWNIIGNSPIDFFNPKFPNPCFASAGDSLQFFAVDFETHHKILSEVQNGTYIIESEVLDD